MGQRHENMVRNISEDLYNAIASTFDQHTEKLPKRDLILPFVEPYKDRSLDEVIKGMKDVRGAMVPFAVRDLYLKNAFVVYTDEMLTAIKGFCDAKQMKLVHEVCCGTGWLSHWMRKYGVPMGEAVDNKTWKYEAYLPIVRQEDAAKFVKRSGDADMFVLSWAYMNPLAARIWKNMKPGQYMLYIGEGRGGCTADDEFFQLTDGKQIQDDEDFNKIDDAFVQFYGLHDRPELYQKT
jgi:hypothetical protein